MTKIYLCLLLLNFHELLAQQIEWFEGSLVLDSDEVHVGLISLEAEHDLILFQERNSRMVYPAYKIKSIFFYDSLSDINRRYLSLKTEDRLRKRHQLYEVVLSGSITLLRRKKVNMASGNTDADDYNYFTLYHQVLTPLNKFRSEIFPQLRFKSHKQLDGFISTANFVANPRINSIRIIKYYNSLAKDDGPLARN